MSVKIFSKDHQSYPERLRQLHKAPQSIHVIGGKIEEMLSKPLLGVVGSRKVSSYGREVTTSLAGDFARKGGVIVSGLALGVDSIAHKAALYVGGYTAAVLPSGIESIYPASHTGLARQIILKKGMLISEYEGKTKPQKHQFIERNRIIAALSDALLVTEAAENSGSLHTARFALELGKPVLAVPGNITSPTSRGTNNLIKAGAVPITSTQDLFDALDINITDTQTQQVLGDTSEETIILDLLASGESKGSILFEKSNLSVEKYQQTLTMLEIKGQIRPLGNDNWALA